MSSDIVHVSTSDLTGRVVSREVPQSEEYRRLYGSQTNMDLIEDAVRGAEMGFMADLCDLETEVMRMDTHLSGVLSKRVGALEAADWDLTEPEDVPREDRAWAARICSEMTTIVRAVPYFSERVADLAWATYDGRSALEVQWTPGAHRKRIAPTGLDWVHPRRLAFGRRREVRIVDGWRHSAGFASAGIALDDYPGKFLSWTPRLFREYPEREGLGPRTLYWCFFKRFSWRYRMKLTEMFGLPWRIVEVDKDAPANPESIDAAKAEASGLGGESTAVFDRGIHMRTEAPDKGAADIFGMTHEQVNAEVSKLVLGNPGTTDAVANRAESIVHRGEQEIIIQRDGSGCGARIEQQFIRVAVGVIYGADAVRLAPRFTLRVQPTRDRAAEMERVAKVLSFGLAVPETFVREASGIRGPSDDETFIVLAKSGGVDAVGNPLPASYQVVTPGEPTTPGGEPGAPPAAPGAPPAAPGAPPGPSAPAPPANPLAPPQGAAAAEDEEDEGELEDEGTDGAAERAIADLLGLEREAGCYLLGPAQPGTANALPATAVNGSPEVLVGKGLKDGVRVAERWTAAMLDACEGAATAPQLYRRLARAADALDLESLARAIERRMVHAAALGALDSDWEAENDRVIKPPPFSVAAEGGGDPFLLAGGGVADFAAKPFAEALKFFRSKNVMSRRAFDRLGAEAKRKAFTIAGLQSKRVLEVAHTELSRALEAGADLRGFRGQLAERMELAGWSAANPSHVEVVFRNAVNGSYASGRDAQMRQPEVLAARPYWQILGVKDARTRETHATALGKVLRADDGFWKRAPIPFGHNCRCRKVSRSAEAVKRLGLQVIEGTALRGLPDEGWDGGQLSLCGHHLGTVLELAD